MALQLNEKLVLKQAFDSVPVDSISLVVKSMNQMMIQNVLKFLAEEIVRVIVDILFLTYLSIVMIDQVEAFRVSSDLVFRSTSTAWSNYSVVSCDVFNDVC